MVEEAISLKQRCSSQKQDGLYNNQTIFQQLQKENMPRIPIDS